MALHAVGRVASLIRQRIRPSETVIIASMPRRAVRAHLIAALVAAAATSACRPAPPGTHYWVQVQREFVSQDYGDTLNYLDDVLRTGNTFNIRAAALKVVLLGGLGRAAFDIGEACAAGIYRVAKWDAKPYQTCIYSYRSQTRARTLALIEALAEFNRVAADAERVELDFPLPKSSSGAPSALGRTRVGAMPVAKAFEPSVVLITDRRITLQVLDILGAEDVTAVAAKFELRPVSVSKASFLRGVAKTLFITAAVFDRDRLDDSVKREAVLKAAQQSLAAALESGDSGLRSEAEALAHEIRAELGR